MKKSKMTIKDILSINGMGVMIAFIVLCIALAISTDSFLTAGNIMVVLRQSVWVGIISIGMTFIIATGEIDLSIGSVIGFTGMCCAAMMKNYSMNIYLAMVLTLLIGAVIGFLNAVLVSKLKIASFIATLATMQIFRGLIYVYTQGVPIFGLNYPEFQFIAQGYVGFLPVPIIIVIILTIIFWYVMYRTKYGRNVLTIGSNIDAAKLVGINVGRIKTSVYIIMGVLGAIAGMLLTARSEAAVVEAGSGYETDAIAAVVIAGTSMAGGNANLLGCLLGAVLMTTIRNGLNILKVDSSWHQVVIGIVIVLALIFDKFAHQDKE
ncbi:MAG: ABC transporter permease [Lachnospiraceae bacterium]|nr:ABC transporter permease [Lachnospiraceae bacterium]MDD3615489.1 ABC transporter permease [Lachnospiraceae bacterium]